MCYYLTFYYKMYAENGIHHPLYTVALSKNKPSLLFFSCLFFKLRTALITFLSFLLPLTVALILVPVLKNLLTDRCLRALRLSFIAFFTSLSEYPKSCNIASRLT